MKIFDNRSKKFLTVTAIFLVIGAALFVFQLLHAEKVLTILPIDPANGWIGYVTYSLIDEVAGSFILAAIVAIFFDVSLRSDMISELNQLVLDAQRPREFNELRMSRNMFDTDMSKDISSLQPGQSLALIGTSQRVVFSDKPGIAGIAEKVRSGVHFQILVLHPDSMIVPCIQNLSKDFGFSDLKASLQETYLGRIHSLGELLKSDQPILGSIEVRLLKDLFSPFSLHKSPNLTLVGFYFAHESGTQCPVLSLAEGEFKEQIQKHFDRLWTKSLQNVLLKADQGELTDNTHAVFELPNDAASH